MFLFLLYTPVCCSPDICLQLPITWTTSIRRQCMWSTQTDLSLREKTLQMLCWVHFSKGKSTMKSMWVTCLRTDTIQKLFDWNDQTQENQVNLCKSVHVFIGLNVSRSLWETWPVVLTTSTPTAFPRFLQCRRPQMVSSRMDRHQPAEFQCLSLKGRVREGCTGTAFNLLCSLNVSFSPDDEEELIDKLHTFPYLASSAWYHYEWMNNLLLSYKNSIMKPYLATLDTQID